MDNNPLCKLLDFGQSVWLDYLHRKLFTSGELQKLIDEDCLRGMTSNPSIFEKAIAGSHDYDKAIRVLALEGKNVEEIYEALAVDDVQHATDIFRPLYDKTDGRDGFVSLEVAPQLAHDTAGTISEARRLWAEVSRPNVMIKVPATLAGLPAIEKLISEGINVNITLLFGLPRYREVAEAYIAGLEKAAAQGLPLAHIASVASFFLSRIDVLLDPLLDDIKNAGGRKAETASGLRGQVAILSAKVAFQIYKEVFGGERFAKLAAKGARTQRLLWASTSTKDPSYSDVKYVDALIGPETVNTIPTETLNAYRDHGKPATRLREGMEKAQDTLNTLAKVGIDIDEVTRELENEGVAKFVNPFNQLMDTLGKARNAAIQTPVDLQSLDLAKSESAFRDRVADLEEQRFSTRLWRKDPTLWSDDLQQQAIISDSLGWLHVADKMEENLVELDRFRAELVEAGFKHVVHMGMGGSSLAPMVFERTFSPGKGGLSLTVLDSTDPATILKIEKSVLLTETLFIVASKSGTTAEPLAFGEYFYAKLKAAKGDKAGENMAVITDPETPLAKMGQERGYRRVFTNYTDIGGRYSALSYFGLVPAALLGLDLQDLLLRTLRMEYACSSDMTPAENAGVLLGAAMGELARRGRDKVTFLVPEQMASLGMWLEQLLAESTGKQGTGILPVAGEPIGNPSVYGDDRFFVYFYLKGHVDDAQDRGVVALRKAGHPVVTIETESLADVGQEFFRWEIATAAAGSVLHINAFDQPNVQESKDNTNRLLKVVRDKGQLPDEKPALVEAPLSLYFDTTASTVAAALESFFSQAKPGDYVALMAYLTEEPETEKALQDIRLLIRDKLRLATTLGYGPRFLHSTGQYHKGGPNTGLFIQLTADDKQDADVPDEPYTFGVLKRAQAQGDLEALRKHGRRVIRIHLGQDVSRGLAAVKSNVTKALPD